MLLMIDRHIRNLIPITSTRIMAHVACFSPLLGLLQYNAALSGPRFRKVRDVSVWRFDEARQAETDEFRSEPVASKLPSWRGRYRGSFG